MDILHLVDRLEEFFNEARAVPFTRSVVVNEDRMLELIDQMRIAIPDEVKKAQQLLAQRDRILAQGQEEGNRTIALAREKAEELIERDQITTAARLRAEQIIAQARGEADATRRDADNYVIDVLTRFETDLERILTQVRNGIHSLQSERERYSASASTQAAAPPPPQTETAEK
jgi:cell division septum initiation protein DivIVA